MRLLQIRLYPLPGDYNIEHLRAFHRQIFGDVYPWAGEIRTIAIAKTDLFALPQHIEPFLADVLAELAAEQHLRGLDLDRLVDRLTHFLAEINAAHPFREGNGRTQRAFIGQLANQAGYRIAWERADPTRNIDASVAAMRGDNAPLRTMLNELVEPLSHASR
ncbi:MAG: Fic/DOC family protein [Solirubrobacteraceae bacterium]